MNTVSDQAPLSIVICTYNRAASLYKALASFARCHHSPAGLPWELVIVDNASTDETHEVVRAFQKTSLPLRYLHESVQGLSHARNHAVAKTAGFLLFTDDDVQIDENWISAYVAAAETYPEIQFFGGRVKPAFPKGRPAWLHNENMDLLDGLFVNYDLGGTAREITRADILPVGASMGFRRTCLTNPFRTDLGVCGRNMGRGEDTEFLKQLMTSGHRGFYVAQALSHHEVSPDRLTFRYAFHYGMACQKDSGSKIRAATFLLRGFYQLLLGRSDRARQCLIRSGMEIGT